MSNEYTIGGNFLTGKIDAAEYRRKMARLASQCSICGEIMVDSDDAKDPTDPRINCGGDCLGCIKWTEGRGR